MKKVIALLLGFILVLTISACGDKSSSKEAPQDIKEMVHDYSVLEYEDVSASITSEELIVTDSNEEETRYELPEDEFFVSIAPYIETTHPCTNHSLTGCQGELVEEEFDVYIEADNGEVIVDETMTTLSNGFIDLWLPRDQAYQVKIKHDGKTAESEISTFEGDNTCITTIQLS